MAISYNFLSLSHSSKSPWFGAEKRGKHHKESKDQTGVAALLHPNPNLSHRCVCLTPYPFVPMKSILTHPLSTEKLLSVLLRRGCKCQYVEELAVTCSPKADPALAEALCSRGHRGHLKRLPAENQLKSKSQDSLLHSFTHLVPPTTIP